MNLTTQEHFDLVFRILFLFVSLLCQEFAQGLYAMKLRENEENTTDNHKR